MYVTTQTVKVDGKYYPPKTEISLPRADAERLLISGAITRQMVEVPRSQKDAGSTDPGKDDGGKGKGETTNDDGKKDDGGKATAGSGKK